MSSGGGNAQSFKNPTPTGQNEQILQNGQLVGQRVFDAASGAWQTNTFLTPDQQRIQSLASGGLTGTLNQLQGGPLTPQDQAYQDSFIRPQLTALNDAYSQASSRFNTRANASGMGSSAGFADYYANQLDKNKAQATADIYDQATQNTAQRQMSLANLYSGLLGAGQSQQQNFIQPLMAGQQFGSQMSAQYNPPKNSRGFFSKLLGG